ncbi:hypothetical protein HU755_01055 [Pseudomonas sp. SWRI111]|uniref:RCC1 domain-containing protein n=1 Tax=Pseudomonas sp. SWRI111 TaxID=2745507 RepID=UPI001644E5F4|nr:hypothetical protein [Pseudomonas sp. SWRI111]MBC3205358.1 hypothetical protein [Pseudomonas sp. SWRI111]
MSTDSSSSHTPLARHQNTLPGYLPVATFLQATGKQKDLLGGIYPNGATVIIPAKARLKEGDQITVTLEGQTTTTHPHTVLAAEADKELTSIKIGHARIVAEQGEEIALSYQVERKAGGTDGPSDPTVYDVREVVDKGSLRVLGARSSSEFKKAVSSRILSAFHAQTGKPLKVEWKYASSPHWEVADSWRDDLPQQLLQVRTDDDQLTINPSNIIGGETSYIAIRDEGDVVGWSHPKYGDIVPSNIAVLKDIVAVSCSVGAYAILRANQVVNAWGEAEYGGDMGDIDPSGFTKVVSSAWAFTGLRETGRLTAWGDPATGGVLPEAIGALNDIVEVTSNPMAFAAQRINGEVVTWGNATTGGEIPVELGKLTDIKKLVSASSAFAGLRSTGQIVAWGKENSGGMLPEPVADLTDVIELTAAHFGAFCAIRRTGQVVAWGNTSYGGVVDPVIAEMKDIVDVSSTNISFAARRANGHVVAWGNSEAGGTIPADIAQLDDIVQVCGSGLAYAALRKNGTVVAWGNVRSGGDLSPVAEQLTQVQALYSNGSGFVALTSGGRVVTWGDPERGGDSSPVQDRLRGQVSYLANPVSRGLALKAQRLRTAGADTGH